MTSITRMALITGVVFLFFAAVAAVSDFAVWLHYKLRTKAVGSQRRDDAQWDDDYDNGGM